MFICFVGIDGSGKTVQAEKLVERLKDRGISCAYMWCRYSPRLLMPLIWVARKLIRRSKGGSEYSRFTSAKRGVLRRPLLGWLWLNISLLEYLVQVTFTARVKLRRRRNLICDRYVHDMLADMAINLDRSGSSMLALARHPMVRLFPIPDRVFFLDVSPDVAFARKSDPNVMGKQYLEDRAEIYDRMSRTFGFLRIDGAKSIEEIADIVLDESLRCVKASAGDDKK